MLYEINPVAKPRMTQRDKWKPAAQRYWAYKALVRLHRVELPLGGALVVFVMPMPKSWPKYKKKEMFGKPHQQRPDLDNLIKGLGDAVYDDDSKIWHIEAKKIWGKEGAIIINNVIGDGR